MTSVRLPLTGRDLGRPVVAAGLIGACLGVVGVALLSTQTIALVVVIALVVGSLGVALLLAQPSLLLPLCVFSMWLEGVGSGQITLGRVVSVLVFAVFAVMLLLGGYRLPAPGALSWVPIVLFVAWAWLSGLWSTAVGPWLTTTLTLGLGLAYYLVALEYATSPAKLWRLLQQWVVLGIPIALLGIGLYFTLGDERRVPGLSGNANGYATYIVCTFPILTLMLLHSRGRRRLVPLAMFVVYGLAMVTTGSRAGFLGAAVIGVLCVSTVPGLHGMRRLTFTATGLTLLGGGGLVAVWLNPERFSLLSVAVDRGAGRLDIWTTAVATAKRYWPVGMGFGQFRQQSVELLGRVTGASLDVARQEGVRESGVLDTHNQYLQLVLDVGVVGLVLYAVVIGTTLWILWRHARRWPLWRPVIWVLFVVLVEIHIAYVFATQINQKFLWLIFGIAAAMTVPVRLRWTPVEPSTQIEVHRGVG